MWNSYFYNIQKKYSMRLSSKEPLVIRLDGKSVTKSKELNLMEKTNDGFLNTMQRTVEHFTRKYECYAIYGSDEVSFIFTNPVELMEDLDSEKDNHANEIISLFSQYFFQYFNSFNKHRIVFWHAKCFSIPKEKITSYIKFRSRIIENVMVTYFLKRYHKNNGELTLDQKIQEAKKYKDYSILEKMQKGILYFNGQPIDLFTFLNGNIISVENQELKDMFSELL